MIQMQFLKALNFDSNKKTVVLLIVSLLFLPASNFAQQDKNDINDTILFKKYAATIKADNTTYFIAKWNGNQAPKDVNTIRQLNNNTAIITASSNKQLAIIIPANNQWKFSPALEKNIASFRNTMVKQFIIGCADVMHVLALITAQTKRVKIINIHPATNAAVIQCDVSYIKDYVADIDAVTFIDEYIAAQTEVNIIGYDRSFHGINLVDFTIPNANGKNIVVGVKERKMDSIDLDVYKRTIPSPLSAAAIDQHATVISSIIGGAGNSYYDGRGIANACKFFSSSFANLFVDDAAILNQNKVMVQNHSYGTVPQQFYGTEAVSYDNHCWQNKNFVHVFSAGNRGSAAATEGKYAGINGYANITGNFKMAKNIITVGGVTNLNNVSAESSAGPLYDGRLAPQLTALGPNGTSDAAAMVTGAVAVLQQVYADSNNQNVAAASLVKALLYNTAEDIYKTGIDYKTGYGLLNSFAAIKSLQQKKYDGSTIAQNQNWIKNITVPANTAQLKVTLVWTDIVATANNNKALINDLDLEVIELNTGTVYKPWVLSTAANADSLEKLPARKRDSLNTSEQVSILLPPAGNYQVKVTGTNVSTAAQSFHITFNTDTLNTFRFTNPQHTSDVNREENPNLTIQWKTFIADTNQTGNLYISYNNSNNWQLIKNAQKLYTSRYVWPIKDTASTAQFKMETAFGSFLSQPIIISKITRITVDFVCTDSIRLSWNKHVYANNYKLYLLADSAYLKPVFTTTDTFVVINRSQFGAKVFAVEPQLNNNLPAARSIAIDVEAQAVNCFYRSLNYNLLNGNDAELVLDLSVPGYADSIAFEKITTQGSLLKTYGAVKASNATTYNTLINTLDNGTSYFRARIKLKSGGIVYSDIVAILTSGTNKIYFYPSPANKNGTVNYILQQGMSPNSRLQLYDVNGCLLRNYTTLPNQLNLSGLPTGLLIYKLTNDNGSVIETGKILVIE
jgi:hypothetical protein